MVIENITQRTNDFMELNEKILVKEFKLFLIYALNLSYLKSFIIKSLSFITYLRPNFQKVE